MQKGASGGSAFYFAGYPLRAPIRVCQSMIRKSMPSDLIRGWIPVFPRDKREAFARRSCSNKKIERDDDSKKSHPALGTGAKWASVTKSFSDGPWFRAVVHLTLKLFRSKQWGCMSDVHSRGNAYSTPERLSLTASESIAPSATSPPPEPPSRL